MNFGVIANFGRPGASETVYLIDEWCKKNNHKAFVCEGSQAAEKIPGIEVLSPDNIGREAEVIISCGGDGTILSTARALGENVIPILGINLGSLGFLTQQTPEQLESSLERIVRGDFQIEERLVLKTEMVDGPPLEFPFSLNDVVIDKGNVSRVINISLYANSEYICSYTADGLIVATPTGSTAYSLAVGGPILNPHMQAFIASPISPFSLTSRPLIFPPEFELEIRIRSEHGNALLTIDGQVATHFSPTGSIKITKADHMVKFITFADESFYDILRRKLHWGKLPVVDYEKSDLLKKKPNSNQ